MHMMVATPIFFGHALQMEAFSFFLSNPSQVSSEVHSEKKSERENGKEREEKLDTKINVPLIIARSLYCKQ